MPRAYLVARFIRCFGADAYFNRAFRTRDGIIPAAWFDLLVTHMDAVETADQLRATNAATLAGADGRKPETRWLRRDLERRAFPIIYAPDPAAEDGDA